MTSESAPVESTAGRRRLWASRGTAVVLAATLLSALGTVGGIGFLSAEQAVAAPSSCDTSVPAAVRYSVGPDSSGRMIVVRSITVSGLPAGCDGDPVVVDLYGNSAGDPTVSLAQDELLAQADSTLDACTQQALLAPGLVSRGGVTLTLCPAGGAASVVSVHDLTAVGLRVAGNPVATAGQKSGSQSQAVATPASEGSGIHGDLAFSGAQIAVAVLAGLFAVLAGTLLVALSRRRQKEGV